MVSGGEGECGIGGGGCVGEGREGRRVRGWMMGGGKAYA